MVNQKYQSRKIKAKIKGLQKAVSAVGGSDPVAADMSGALCMFTDRRSRVERREVSQQLPRGARCRRQRMSRVRKMSHALGADWYLQTSIVEKGSCR